MRLLVSYIFNLASFFFGFLISENVKQIGKLKHFLKNYPYLQTRSWLEEDHVWTIIRIRLLMISMISISLWMISTIRIRVSVISTRRISLLMVSTSLLWRSSISESLLSSKQDPHPARTLAGGLHSFLKLFNCLMF